MVRFRCKSVCLSVACFVCLFTLPVTAIKPWTLWLTSTVSPDFKAGVTALSNILKIQRHDDCLVMLKIKVGILIQERLSPEAITKVSNNREVN
ncbi:diaphanous 2 [Sarotherodon galilaeus]